MSRTDQAARASRGRIREHSLHKALKLLNEAVRGIAPALRSEAHRHYVEEQSAPRKRFTCARIGVAVLATCWAGYAYSAQPLITEDAATQGAGNFQIELNAEFGKDAENGVTTRSRQFGTLLVAGMTDSLDLMLGQPRLRIATTTDEATTTEEGAGDFSLDLKWRFYRKGAMSLALKPGFTAATGDETRGLGTGRATYALFLVGSLERQPWALHLHAGYKANRNRLGEPVNVVHLSAATVYEATPRIRLVADVARDSDFRLSASSGPAWLLVGAICALGKNLDLDLGLKRGLNRVAEDYTVLLGMTSRW